MLPNRAIACFQLLAIAVFLVVMVPHAAADDQPLAVRRILNSASELDYPPLALVRTDGSADGFSVELLKAVTRSVGLGVNFVVGPWHEIEQELTDGRLDVLPLVSYSTEREKVFGFTAPYLRMHGTIFVRKGDNRIHDWGDLKGREVLMMRGDTAHEYAVNANLSDKLILTDSFEDAMEQLSAGRHDAVVVQQLVGLLLLKKLGISNVVDVSSFQGTSLNPDNKHLSGYEQKFCIAVRNGDSELLALLNEGLTLVIASGIYDRLYQKWFGPILPQPPVPLSLIVKYLVYVLVPVLFVLTVIGLWYLKREVGKKTLNLREKIAEQKLAEAAIREAEARYRLLFEHSPDGIAIIDPLTAQPLYFNETAHRQLGYSHDEFARLRIFDFEAAETPEETRSRIAKVMVEGRSVFETLHRTRQGEVRNIQVTAQSTDILGHAVYHCIWRDITAQKKSEEALRESERKYRELFALSPVGIFKTNSKGQALFVNPEMARILGADSPQAAVDNFRDLAADLYVDPDRRKAFIELMRDRGAVENFEYEARGLDGKKLWLSMNARAREKLSDGTFIIDGFTTDITERKQAEEALRESQEELFEIFSMSLDLICIADINTATFRKVNPAFTRILGYSEQELLNRSFLQFIHPDDVAPTIETLDERLKKGEMAVNFLNRYQCRDGTYRWIEWVSHPVPKRGVSFAVGHDITDRKKSEEVIKQSERRFRQNFESAPFGMAIIDTRRRFLEVNSQLCRILGYEAHELLGHSFNSFTHPDDRQEGRIRWQQLLDGKVDFNRAEKRYIHKDGRELWVIVSNTLIRDAAGDPLYFLSNLMDITDQKAVQAEKEKLETRLQQSQKMEAIGTLAGGMAHDFNNLLMGIQGRASLISLDLDASHPHREHIQAIEEYIRSATHLTRQLLGFARGGKYEVKPVDMNELVLGSSAMFGRTRKEIRILTKCRPSPLVVEADRGQIEQVLLNMYVNAWQAMPAAGGELYLETGTVTLDEAYCKPHQAEAGRYVKVSITDTGAGMEEATRLQIFDPFFTTKEKGRGTGLGLASAYGIIKNHGGMITVYSEIGHGTTFNIYLPLSDKDADREVPRAGQLIRGSATILLVDDEEMIIDVGQAMLEKLGYRVMVCRTGMEAVKVITARGDEFDLVILDLIMPGMDGGTTFDRIRQIRPGMPVLLSSGYAINGQAHEVMRRGCNGFIQKPYNILDLSNKVRHVLKEEKI